MFDKCEMDVIESERRRLMAVAVGIGHEAMAEVMRLGAWPDWDYYHAGGRSSYRPLTRATASWMAEVITTVRRALEEYRAGRAAD